MTFPLASAPDAGVFRPGYVFAGRYRMVNRIGRADREVWRADDLFLQMPVALRLLDLASRPERERILNEVRLARQVTHPAVCRVLDVGEAEDRAFFSMELVQGDDLATILRRVGRFPSERVLEIGHQLCDGLAAAHACGVLHRDVRPANVFVDENGSVRIIDFGFASARDDAGIQTVRLARYWRPNAGVRSDAVSQSTDLRSVWFYRLLVGTAV